MSYQSSSNGSGQSLWSRLRELLFPGSGRTASSGEPRLIQVWDTGRARYRDVDLDNPNDSLWPVANELAALQERQGARPAA